MNDESRLGPALACPVPHGVGDRILLAHGEGARLSRRLIRDVLLSAFDNHYLRPLSDGAVLPPILGQPVVSTDTYVVSPLFFPGGDTGKLAVHGTVNDLAVCGAEPLYLSVGLIIEEGLPLETLRRVIHSMRAALEECGVAVVTGDTKVVPRGAVDKLFINTTGLGCLRPGLDLGPTACASETRSSSAAPWAITASQFFPPAKRLDSTPASTAIQPPLHDLVRSSTRQRSISISCATRHVVAFPLCCTK